MNLKLPRRGRASKVNSKLAKLEREIGAIADRIQSGSRRVKTAANARSLTSKARRRLDNFVKITNQQIDAVIRFYKKRSPMITASIRKVFAVAIQGAPLQHARSYKTSIPPKSTINSSTGPANSNAEPANPNAEPANTSAEHANSNAEPPDSNLLPTKKARAHDILLISVFLGLFAICGIIIAVLFIQIKGLKMELASKDQTIITRLKQVERIANEKIIKEASAPEPQPRHTRIVLSNDDRKLIRQFIKVLPPKPGAKQRIHLDDKISNHASVPVPQSLVDQMPKLRGARFLLDQNGDIIIIGAGSTRADAVVTPN